MILLGVFFSIANPVVDLSIDGGFTSYPVYKNELRYQ